MKRRDTSPAPEAQDTLRALRRTARNALELGLKTGTPVYVIRNNKIVDEQRTNQLESPRQNGVQKNPPIRGND